MRVRPLWSKTQWELGYQDILAAERIQLSFGQGVRLRTVVGEWYFYTYESRRLIDELLGHGVAVQVKTARLRLTDLPR